MDQRGRWYPTAAVLANGSILVMGGETGSNAGPQPNLEILPKPAGGDTVVELPWLARTDPNNLYPFIFVLPTKRVFVGKFSLEFIFLHFSHRNYQVIGTRPEFWTL